MWRDAAGYVHSLWQEIYIGHICWGNPLRSLIEGRTEAKGRSGEVTTSKTRSELRPGEAEKPLLPFLILINDLEVTFVLEISMTRVLFYLSVLSLDLALMQIQSIPCQDISFPPEVSPQMSHFYFLQYISRNISFKWFFFLTVMLILLSLRLFHIQLVISYISQNHFWQPQRICNCVHPAVGTTCVKERGITVTVVLRDLSLASIEKQTHICLLRRNILTRAINIKPEC